MKKKFNKSYNEMDFIDLLQIIWHGKIKVLLITVTIFLISYGYKEFGLWFCIGAHFSYDFVLLMNIRKT